MYGFRQRFSMPRSKTLFYRLPHWFKLDTNSYIVKRSSINDVTASGSRIQGRQYINLCTKKRENGWSGLTNYLNLRDVILVRPHNNSHKKLVKNKPKFCVQLYLISDAFSHSLPITSIWISSQINLIRQHHFLMKVGKVECKRAKIVWRHLWMTLLKKWQLPQLSWSNFTNLAKLRK